MRRIESLSKWKRGQFAKPSGLTSNHEHLRPLNFVVEDNSSVNHRSNVELQPTSERLDWLRQFGKCYFRLGSQEAGQPPFNKQTHLLLITELLVQME